MNHLKKYFIFIVLEVVPLVCLDSACETPTLTQTCDTVYRLLTTKILLLYLHIQFTAHSTTTVSCACSQILSLVLVRSHT